MHHVRQRIDLSVENQIQPHELIGLLRAILRVHRAIAFAHLMGQCEHQRARTCSRIAQVGTMDTTAWGGIRETYG